MYENASVVVENRADPQIYKHTDGYYYYTASLPEFEAIVLRRSETIIGLAKAEEVKVWSAHSEGEMSHYIWAPEIHFIDGGWYIYFAAKGTESLDHLVDPHKIYVIHCKSANPLVGAWEELGQIKTNWESFSLDATTFCYNGTRYLVWAQMDIDIEGNSNIYIAKMKSPYEIEGKQIMLTKPELPWEIIGFKVNEGPAVLIGDSKVIITYSCSATDANYAMGMLEAKIDSDFLNEKSWKKTNEPIRKSDEAINEYGPGHNSFTVAEDEETVLMVYHARDYKEIVGDPLYDINRHTKVVAFDKSKMTSNIEL